MDPMNSYLVRFRRRLRLRDGWLLAQRSLWIPALVSLLVQLAGRLFPIAGLWLLTLLPFGFWLVIIIGYAQFAPMTIMHTARRLDLELGLHERLSTALALQGALAESTGTSTEKAVVPIPLIFPSLVRAQRQDALSMAETVLAAIASGKALALTWLARPLAVAGTLTLAVLISGLLPNPQDLVLAERAAVRQEAETQAQRVEELRKQIESSQELSPEERDKLLQQLAELAQALRANPGDLEQALADLSKLERDLQARLDPNAAAQWANLENLAARLEAMTGTQRDPNSSAAQAAAAALQALVEQMKSMDEAQRQEAAQSLAQMAAQAAQSGDMSLAQALSDLAQAAQSGDAQAASQAMAQAQNALAQAGQRMANQTALQQALAQVQTSSQALASQAAQASAQAAQQGVQAQGTPVAGQGQAPGQGQNPGQAGAPGQGTSPGQGQPGGGGGSTARTLPPWVGGRTNVQSPRGQASDIAASPLQSQVYASWAGSSGSGQQVFIPGQETGQGETQTTQGQASQPGALNPSLVPYSNVFSTYLNTAYQNLQNNYIPSALVPYVQAYFYALAPR
jgi:septal ring factor EnvC (AmiA/AmiB activator)